jgi:DNA-binding beta-propeller fold protein YncE
MGVQFLNPSHPSNGTRRKIAVWSGSIICLGSLVLLLLLILIQIVNPPPVQRLVIEHDFPLPSSLPNKYIPDLRTTVKNAGPLTAGVAVRFDHFDFQALDPRTKLLFIAHSGPGTDIAATFGTGFDADKNANVDGNVVVFDTQQKKLIKRFDIPQVAGMVAASDLGHVYAVDSNDNIVFDIDEKTLTFTQIQVGDNEGPDAIEYDQDDHKLFISDVGVPAPNAKDQANPSPDNQNIAVIDLKTRQVTKINIGHLPKLPGEHADLVKFGYDVGHNKYDSVLHRIFVNIAQLTDQGVAPAPEDEPVGTGEFVEIDPVAQKVVARLQLPDTCGLPHGLGIDAENGIAFIACTEVSEELKLDQNLIRVDVRTMKVIPGRYASLAAKPDMVVLDHKLHVLFVACSSGISVFDIQGGKLKKLGDYIVGKGTHTLAVNEETNELYLPQPDIGGRPTLRIVLYHPDGV